MTGNGLRVAVWSQNPRRLQMVDRLAAYARQFSPCAPLDEQRHEVPNGSAVEPGVIVLNHRGDRLSRDVRVAHLQTVDELLYQGPFA